MDFGAKTDIGKRKTNQDFYYRSESQPLYIIADGMGGHRAGEIASRLSTEIIAEYLEEKLMDDPLESSLGFLIEQAIKEANNIVYKKSLEEEAYKGMGTTISLAYIDNNKVFIGHVGDSSIYILNEKEIIKLTVDHSLVEELLKNGSITRAEAKRHPQKNIITRAVGSSEDIEVDILEADLGSEDILVLSTDGLTNMIEKDEIKRKLLATDDLELACKNLVDLAKERGGHDNITVMAIRK